MKNSVFARLMAVVMVVVLAVSVAAVPASAAASAELKFNYEGMEISGKLAVDSDMLALVAALGSDGQNILNAGMYLGQAGLAIACTPLLDQAYGVSLSSFVEDLKASVFAPDSGSQLALDQATYDELMNALSMGASSMAQINVNPEFLTKAENVGTKYGQMVAQWLTSSAKMDSYNTELTIGGGQYPASVMTLTYDTDSIVSLIMTVGGSMMGDAELKSFLGDYMDLIMSVPGAAMGDMPSSAEMVNELWSELPSAINEATSFFTENGLSVNISIALGESNNLIALGGELTDGEHSLTTVATFIPEYISVSMSMDGEDTYEAAYVVTENSDAAYNAKFALTHNGSDEFYITASWDKVTGLFFVEADPDGEHYQDPITISGVLRVENDTVILAISTINNQRMDLSIILRANDTDVAMPAYQNVLTMSEEEIITLAQNVMAIAESLSQAIG